MNLSSSRQALRDILAQDSVSLLPYIAVTSGWLLSPFSNEDNDAPSLNDALRSLVEECPFPQVLTHWGVSCTPRPKRVPAVAVAPRAPTPSEAPPAPLDALLNRVSPESCRDRAFIAALGAHAVRAPREFCATIFAYALSLRPPLPAFANRVAEVAARLGGLAPCQRAFPLCANDLPGLRPCADHFSDAFENAFAALAGAADPAEAMAYALDFAAALFAGVELDAHAWRAVEGWSPGGVLRDAYPGVACAAALAHQRRGDAVFPPRLVPSPLSPVAFARAVGSFPWAARAGAAVPRAVQALADLLGQWGGVSPTADFVVIRALGRLRRGPGVY